MMKFTLSRTIYYDVIVDEKLAQKLIKYCWDNSCGIEEAITDRQMGNTNANFDVATSRDCKVTRLQDAVDDEVIFWYDGIGDCQNLDNFIATTAQKYHIPQDEIRTILGLKQSWEK